MDLFGQLVGSGSRLPLGRRSPWRKHHRRVAPASYRVLRFQAAPERAAALGRPFVFKRSAPDMMAVRVRRPQRCRIRCEMRPMRRCRPLERASPRRDGEPRLAGRLRRASANGARAGRGRRQRPATRVRRSRRRRIRSELPARTGLQRSRSDLAQLHRHDHHRSRAGCPRPTAARPDVFVPPATETPTCPSGTRRIHVKDLWSKDVDPTLGLFDSPPLAVVISDVTHNWLVHNARKDAAGCDVVLRLLADDDHGGHHRARRSHHRLRRQPHVRQHRSQSAPRAPARSTSTTAAPARRCPPTTIAGTCG